MRPNASAHHRRPRVQMFDQLFQPETPEQRAKREAEAAAEAERLAKEEAEARAKAAEEAEELRVSVLYGQSASDPQRPHPHPQSLALILPPPLTIR